MKCSDMCSNYGKLQDKIIKREPREDSNMTNAESETNKGNSKLLTAEWMWNWSEIFVVDVGLQLARLPFRNTPLGYHKKFGRRD